MTLIPDREKQAARRFLVGARVRIVSGDFSGRMGRVCLPPPKAELGRWVDLDDVTTDPKPRRRIYVTTDRLEAA